MKAKIITIAILLVFAFSVQAQESQSKSETAKTKSNWTVIGNVKYVTQHYWRGLGVGPLFGDAPSFEPSITFTNGKFSVGVSTGASFDNVYKAMIPWVFYSPVKGLKIGITDIYSPGTKFWDTDITDFGLTTSKHFIDASIDYTFPFNLGFKWATLIAGFDPRPTDTINHKRNFTTYIEANYSYTFNRITASAAVAVTPWTGLYNKTKSGVNNIQATVKYTVPLYGKSSLPIWATAGYNPLDDYFQFLVGASIVLPYNLKK